MSCVRVGIYLALLYFSCSFFDAFSAVRDPFHRAVINEAVPVPPSVGFLTLDAEAIELTDLLRQIAAAGQRNMVLASSIQGTVSVHFDHVPWQEALDAVVLAQRLQLREQGSIVFIEAFQEILKQVRIKARVVELTDQASQVLGMELRQSFGDPLVDSGVGVIRQHVTADMDAPEGLLGLGFSYLPKGFHLDLELAALEAEGSARVISSPELLVLNHEEAWIHQGKELPYVTSFKKDTTAHRERSVLFKKAVLSLKVRPHILDEEHVQLDVEVNKDSAALDPPALSELPAIDTRQISTHVLVKENQTIVLGGIIEVVHHQSRRGLPWLNHIPGLAWLSSQEEKRLEKKEVMLFLTVAQGSEVIRD